MRTILFTSLPRQENGVRVKHVTFEVDVAEDEYVPESKDVIKAKKQETIKCNANDMQLYRAKTANGAWLNEAGAATVTLDENRNLQGFEQIDPMLWINNDKNFGKNFQPGEGQVHVLFQGNRPRLQLSAKTVLSITVAINSFHNSLRLSKFIVIAVDTPSNTLRSVFIQVNCYSSIIEGGSKLPEICRHRGHDEDWEVGVHIYYALWRLIKDKKRVLLFSKMGSISFDDDQALRFLLDTKAFTNKAETGLLLESIKEVLVLKNVAE
ncbi:LOW QUALITY PROTEIN: Crinkler (CRN) [Phytophthora megakarya]|uniref:Crinkler (CRN) n=1 Tax=Phytophthora megakarya TaxID=4795 RepID=A0A225VTW7_9STRA|nr:LOW QUALITY PROTEIN: Crinkler (CRN) [Phytophthora megakarya]